MLMRLVVLVVIVCSLQPPLAAAALPPEDCSRECGDVAIPYPFGMTEECCLNENYLITCNTSFSPPKPFLRQGNINVVEISLTGELRILNYVGRKCFNGVGDVNPWLSLEKFSINDTLNKFVVVGCDSYGFLQHDGFTTGCMSICNSLENVDGGSACNGVGCCKTSVAKHMFRADITVGSFFNHTYVMDFNPCTYAFIVEDDRFKFLPQNLTDLQYIDALPVALAWTIGNETCDEAKQIEATYACIGNSTCYDVSEGYSGYRCSYLEGYGGNPYLPDGCRDIDECEDDSLNECMFKDGKYCENVEGSYKCSCPLGYSGEGRGDHGCIKNRNMKIAYAFIGIVSGCMILLLAAILMHMEIKKTRSEETKLTHFLQNGGLFLQEKIMGKRKSQDTVKIFTSSELHKATNAFHGDMIIGQGGFGTVYKGMLPDKRVVAIKKSKTIDPSQIEQFANEVFVLSQVNHRNVVRLLGCCLETEVPLLVYEFINNGTLSSHLHDRSKARFLNWETRLRIAAETAGVLAYLHSAASTPIIHRDVKTDNILVDKAYTAKVSDFGASKLVPLDLTHMSTMVQGTFGYLDPEYLQTNQLTEKSDVYSFGVVLLELLTGRKAISFDKPDQEKNLANFFLTLLRKGRVHEILDDNVVESRNKGQVLEVAWIARACLNVKGEDRPSMKEVALQLEGLIHGGKYSWPRNMENVEEEDDQMESLLCVNGLNALAFDSGVGYDSIMDHVISPMRLGR